MRIAFRLFLVLSLVAGIAQILVWYQSLPEQVPFHFGVQGLPDAWSGRHSVTLLYSGLHIANFLFFGLLAYGIKFIPNSAINIPNKEYWLAPGRRPEVMAFNANLLIFIGIATHWLLTGLFQLSSLVAIKRRDSIEPEFWWIFGIYLAAVLGACIYLMLKFRKPATLEAN